MPLDGWAPWVRWCTLGDYKAFSQLKKKHKKEQLHVCFKMQKMLKYKMESITAWCAPKGAVWWNISSQEGKGGGVSRGEHRGSSDGYCGRADSSPAQALCALCCVHGNLSHGFSQTVALPSTSPCTEFISVPLLLSLLKMGFILHCLKKWKHVIKSWGGTAVASSAGERAVEPGYWTNLSNSFKRLAMNTPYH